MSKSSQLIRENTVPRLRNGAAGDGINKIPIGLKSVDRIPVRSARKFTAPNAQVKNDEGLQVKLKFALDELRDVPRSRLPLQKAQSVAEITPTKSRKKKSLAQTGGGETNNTASALMLATPRPGGDASPSPASRRLRDHDEERRRRLVYQRLLLLAWRRSKTRLVTLSDSLRRRQDQIVNLEKQVDCLKGLTQSECNKRNEAINDCQRMRGVVETVQHENESLKQEKGILESELENVRMTAKCVDTTLENLKNEVNTKNVELKRLLEEKQRDYLLVRKLREEKMTLINQIQDLNVDLGWKVEVVTEMEQNLKNTQSELKSVCKDKKSLEDKLKQLNDKYEMIANESSALKIELALAKCTKESLFDKVECLERKSNDLTDNYSQVLRENEELKQRLGVLQRDRKCWWKNARDFVCVSWVILQNAAYIMLPAV